jgi:hypothetical protein
MARRSKANWYRDKCESINAAATEALFLPVRQILTGKVQDDILALVDKRIDEIQRHITALKAIDSTINVGPVSERTRIEVIFKQPNTYIEGSNVNWLNSYPVFRTVLEVKHRPYAGKQALGAFMTTKNQYSDIFSHTFHWDPPYNMLGEPLNPDDTESISNMLSNIHTIHTQFGKWTQQFRLTEDGNVNKDAIHHACHFSSTFAIWARKYGVEPKVYMRRPNVQLAQAMSPELNATLLLAYSLNEAQNAKEATDA